MFDLNVKGDSAEFLSVLLKILHLYQVDVNARPTQAQLTFEDILDTPCGEKCLIHQKCFLNVKQVIECRCGMKKQQDFSYYNNFIHVVNGTEFLETLNSS
jgi:hypothetical protein